MSCRIAIRTLNGNYVTAVNGGGMGEAANKLPLHTDATKAGAGKSSCSSPVVATWVKKK
jgi:hypothetical protein